MDLRGERIGGDPVTARLWASAGDEASPLSVVLEDRESADRELIARPHEFAPEDRFVVAIGWGDEDDERGGSFEACGSVAVALDAPSAARLHAALGAWLDEALPDVGRPPSRVLRGLPAATRLPRPSWHDSGVRS